MQHRVKQQQNVPYEHRKKLLKIQHESWQLSTLSIDIPRAQHMHWQRFFSFDLWSSYASSNGAWNRANSPWRLLDFHARDYRECLACFRSSSPLHIDVVTDLDERIFLAAAAPVHLCTVLWHRRMAFYSRWCCDNSRCRLNFVRACHLDPAWQSTVPLGCFVDCGSRSMLWSRENKE